MESTTCPHTPEDDCGCRKPRTGLLERARKEIGFELETAFVVGDKPVRHRARPPSRRNDVPGSDRIRRRGARARTGELRLRGRRSANRPRRSSRACSPAKRARRRMSRPSRPRQKAPLGKRGDQAPNLRAVRRCDPRGCPADHEHLSVGRQSPAVRERRKRRRLPAHGGRVRQPPHEGVRPARAAGGRLDHRQLVPDGVHQRLRLRGCLLPPGRHSWKAAGRPHRDQHERRLDQRDPGGGRRAPDRHANDRPDGRRRPAAGARARVHLGAEHRHPVHPGGPPGDRAHPVQVGRAIALRRAVVLRDPRGPRNDHQQNPLSNLVLRRRHGLSGLVPEARRRGAGDNHRQVLLHHVSLPAAVLRAQVLRDLLEDRVLPDHR